MAEAAVASRNLGLTCFWQGDFTEAKATLEETLRLCAAQHDPKLNVSFGQDSVAAAKSFLAQTTWVLGEVTRARELTEHAIARAVETTHVPTLVNAYWFKASLEVLRGDADEALRDATRVIELSREHGIANFLALGMPYFGWARARLDDRETGGERFREAIAAIAASGTKYWVPFFQGLLAEVEAERQEVEQALTRIDEALALAQQTGEHWTDAFLHRLRGEILLKRDPANPAPAEDALLTAIAIAQQQKARSFELRAALDVARLYNSTSRSVDAHAVLAPALEGFSPTPEFPEIAEAQTLLSAVTS
jgi:predicted ATPase